MRAFVFPGQGSQKIGMGKDLAESFPSAKAVFDEYVGGEGGMPGMAYQFDPAGFAESNPEMVPWFREAELKHGRVAMAAFVGFLVNYQGITFPADLTMSGEKFSSLGTGNPLLAWDNISDKGKWSILGFIGLLEVLGEAEKPHYMRGGKPGTHDLVWYFGSKYLSGKTEEQKLRSRTAEINNGRLAMIGIMGFIAASTVPGSVPYFTEDLTQYSGSVWAPF